MRNKLTYGFLAGLASVIVTALVSVAQAATVSGSASFTVYQANTPNTLITDPKEQANLANPLINDLYKIGTGTVTGDFDFWAQQNSIGSFFTTTGANTVRAGSYTYTGSALTPLSASNFSLTTVIVFTGYLADTYAGIVRHDDGVSLYAGYSPGAPTEANQKIAPNCANPTCASSYPVAPTNHNYAGLGGFWTGIFVAANNLPQQLLISWDERSTGNADPVVPLPAALPLLLAGLAGLGLIGRMRKRYAN